MIRDPERLVGKRFATDFRIAAVEPGRPDDAERVVTLYMYGERYALSLGELSTLIERGFISEIQERKAP